MLVEIGNLPAVCHSMDCGFKYVPAVGEITGVEFKADTKVLTVTGTELPAKLADIQSLTFAQSPCTVAADATLDGKSITCTLSRNPTCGSWSPKVTTAFGNIAINAESVKEIAVACTIISAVPDSPLNLLGSDNITFTGTNFPHEIEGNTFELTFEN